MKPIIIANTGTSDIAVVISMNNIGSQAQLEFDEMKLHLSAAATAANTLTVNLRSKSGSAYDAKLYSQAMVGVQDILWQPERPIKLNGRDRIAVAWTNDAAADNKTWGLLVNVKA